MEYRNEIDSFFYHCPETCCASSPFSTSDMISGSPSCCSHSWSVSAKASDKTFKYKISPPKSDVTLNFHSPAVGKENMVCSPSLIPLTLLFFSSSFNPSDDSGFSRFGNVKMNEKNGFVLFSLNYSMASA